MTHYGSTNSQTRPWLMPAVIIVAAALLLGGIGVVIGLLARQNSAAPTYTSSPTGDTVPSASPSYQPESPPSPPNAPAGVATPGNRTGQQRQPRILRRWLFVDQYGRFWNPLTAWYPGDLVLFRQERSHRLLESIRQRQPGAAQRFRPGHGRLP